MKSEYKPLGGEWKGSPGNRGAPLMSGNRMKKMKISENYVEMNVMFWYSIVVGRWRGDILEIIFGEIVTIHR